MRVDEAFIFSIDEPTTPHLDYEPPRPPPPRIWGIPRDLWFLLACIFAFVTAFAGFAAHGSPYPSPDILFILITTALFVLSLLNAFRLLLKKG